MDLKWREGVASTDRWIGTLDGAAVGTRELRVTHLIIKRGLLLPIRLEVPFESVMRADQDSIWLDLTTPEVLRLPRADSTDRTANTALLGGSMRLLSHSGAGLRLKGVRLATDGAAMTHLLAARPGSIDRIVLVPIDRIFDLSTGEVSPGMEQADFNELPDYRLDPVIERDVWAALYDAVGLSIDMRDVQISVAQGTATLDGHVKSPDAALDAERVVRTVRGVVAVDNRLLNDLDIDLAVAGSIAKDHPKLLDGVAVHTHLGSVALRGQVASEELRVAVVGAADSTAGVRAVVDSIEVRPPPPSGHGVSQAEAPAPGPADTSEANAQ